MVATRIEILLDKENQVIRQVIEGNVDEQDALYLTEETEKKIHELTKPDKVDILLDAAKLGKPDSGARKILYGNLKRRDVNKIAVVSKSPAQRAIINLVLITTRTKKLRIFATETDAYIWLHST
jgi:hypothetical protein